MEAILNFIQAHKTYFDAAHALTSVVNLVGWCAAAVILVSARRRIESLSFGPFTFKLKQEAVEAATIAARAWQATVPDQKIDVPLLRRHLHQKLPINIIGKSILWVDDNPANNLFAVRALRKLNLDVEQTTSTEAAIAAIERRSFDLVISDMGRGQDMRAGYDLLKQIRDRGSQVPFFIFAGSDRPEFRREAATQGAQLSTNDMLELIDQVVKYLGAQG